VKGWIYADLERLVVEDGRCSIAFRLLDPQLGNEMKRLETKLADAQRGGLNTTDEVFAVLRVSS